MLRGIRGIGTIFAATAALGLCCQTATAKDLVWARYGDIDTLDPHRATSTLSLQVWSLIYDTSVSYTHLTLPTIYSV